MWELWSGCSIIDNRGSEIDVRGVAVPECGMYTAMQ
jgi:hypothetical protein